MPGTDQPATPDELAALYLRARDVPCAKCGYNRRDGAAAACPECGETLRLSTSRDHLETATAYTASAVSVTIACCAVISCGSTIFVLAKYWPGTTEYIAIGLLLGAIFCTIFGVLNAVKSQSQCDEPALRRFIGITGTAAALFTIGLMMSLWQDVF